jgi:hypothetical protein
LVIDPLAVILEPSRKEPRHIFDEHGLRCALFRKTDHLGDKVALVAAAELLSRD